MKGYRYKGSGNTGSFAWLMQRLSGLIVAICGSIFFYEIAVSGSHTLSNSLLLVPILVFAIWHTFSGLKMITDDYVSCIKFRFILLFLYWGLGICALGAGIKILTGLL